jgi:hypothetical protein
MKDSKALLLKYLGSIADPDLAAALFAEGSGSGSISSSFNSQNPGTS